MSEAAAARALLRRSAAAPADVMTLTYAEYLFSTDPARLQFDYVHRFLSEQSYWARGVSSEVLRTAMQNSVCFGVYRGSEQVGFARVVSDRSRFAYLCDVFVQAELRGQGLGKRLIDFVLDHPAVREAARCLLGTRDAHTFYERAGFARDSRGRFMERLAG